MALEYEEPPQEEFFIPQQRQAPFQSPMQAYGSGILMLTNPKDELHSMELTLRNVYLNGNDEEIAAGEPLMNENGIRSVMGLTQSIVSRVTIMSHLERRDVVNLVDYLADTLAYDLMLNRVHYNIRSNTARKKIYFTALSTAYITMLRALDQGERKFLAKAQQEITHTVNQQEQRRQGLFSRMLGWGKK